MSKATLFAKFTDPDTCLHACEHLVQSGVKVREVYSPFPIHGIDGVLSIPKTRISTAAFFYGVTGTTLGFLMMWYMNVQDWPMDIGGKPSFSLLTNLPAFVPVGFEITILIAAHGMIGSFFLATRLFPGMPARNPEPRSTNDLFVVEIVGTDNPGTVLNDLKSDLMNHGAIECSDDVLRYEDQ